MSRLVYCNGDYCSEEEAKVSIFDRGLLFADGVYEVVGVLEGKLLDFERHMARLDRSLGELSMENPLSRDELLEIHRRLVAENGLTEGLVYLQITRGAADRDFVWEQGMTPTVFLFTQEKPLMEDRETQTGIAMKSVEDLRWARRDIKSVGLLAQVLAKHAAKAAGAKEALMVMDGVVTEGGATSVFIVKDGKVITRPLSNMILPGVTRGALLELAEETDIEIEERPVTLAETYEADEAFITGASTFWPVIEIDGKRIGGGQPGPVARRLRELYLKHARATAI
ncbi:MAG: D-amino-acid transaminase [Kiloniellales bacterium]|nr:D-amino-acid transaminase [Kiloniellales bacterium]